MTEAAARLLNTIKEVKSPRKDWRFDAFVCSEYAPLWRDCPSILFPTRDDDGEPILPVPEAMYDVMRDEDDKPVQAKRRSWDLYSNLVYVREQRPDFDETTGEWVGWKEVDYRIVDARVIQHRDVLGLAVTGFDLFPDQLNVPA